MRLERAILVQGSAKPVRGPLIYLPRSNSLQAPFRARGDIEGRRVRYLRMINPGNLPQTTARLTVTLCARIELGLVLDDPKREFGIYPIFLGLCPYIGLHLLGGCFPAWHGRRIRRNAGQARRACLLALMDNYLHREGGIPHT